MPQNIPLEYYLALSAIMFVIGAAGVVTQKKCYYYLYVHRNDA